MPLNPQLWLAVLLFVAWLAGTVRLALGSRRIAFVRDVEPVDPGAAPRVSVVIAARDEERGIRAGLRSVLAQRYPDLEVIVVDDRSTDATGPILDRVALEEPRLHVVHLDRLPPGWLGKNHALHVGAAAATGEWVLFTDADVVMHPDTVARALGYALATGADHLAAVPELRMRGPLLNLFGGVFSLLFAQFSTPWRVRDPDSDSHLGVGAFNLLRADAYRAVGGHRPIAMRPDDDLKLGKLVKRHGFRQDVLFGRDMISVEWYASVPEAVRGLEKNAFAGLNYSLAAVLASSLALLLLNVWPFAALLATTGAARVWYAATAAVAVAAFAASTRASGSSPWLAPALPLGTLLFVYILLRATGLTLLRGGIRWRGTHYPLDQLRANRV